MKIKIGYLGPDPVTFGYLAAKKFFNGIEDAEFISYHSHSEIISAVGKMEVDYGVVAIENVIDGIIAETVQCTEDEAGRRGLYICGEVAVPIELYCLRKADDLTPPKKILTHDSVTRQCRKFISKLQNEGAMLEITNSTAEAAQKAGQNSEIAVIASEEAAKKYGLRKVVPESVADIANNKTRFWVLSKSYAKRTGKDKTCFLVNLEQTQSGALWKTIGFFAKRNINLLIIYSNPIPGKHWEYTFLIELVGHIDDNNMEEAWEELRNSGLITGRPHFLGSYPDTTSGI